MTSGLDLRLIVITDRTLAGERSVVDIVRAALAAGAPAIQVRDKDATARELAELTRKLLPLAKAADALLFVNDRLDVALATGADGVHLGPDDIPLSAARRIAPAPFIIGCSTDDPVRARELERDGASYIGCGAVFGTVTKDTGGERIGIDRLNEVARAVSIPVVAIGGVSPDTIDQVVGSEASGAAVVGAVMAASDPAAVTLRLLEGWGRGAG
ncbi:MAG TPA: thiamine phosphate synthase [Longimicrobiales bacterium]|nr:thiamine phosphate synthase [Longimicrobiales bacterium]